MIDVGYFWATFFLMLSDIIADIVVIEWRGKWLNRQRLRIIIGITGRWVVFH
jgi:hypothetical protein